MVDSALVARKRSLGTALAISSTLMATAYHNLRSRRHGELRENLSVGFECGMTFRVEYEDGDPDADVALLRLASEQLPDSLDRAVILQRQPRVLEPWMSCGYPQGYSVRRMLGIGGQVRLVEGEPQNGDGVLQLHCAEAAAGQRVKGFSGAPVFVDADVRDDEVAVVGLIVRGLARSDNIELVEGGTIFASSAVRRYSGEEEGPDEVGELIADYGSFVARPDVAEGFAETSRALLEQAVLQEAFALHRDGRPGRRDRALSAKRRRRASDVGSARPSPNNWPAVAAFEALLHRGKLSARNGE